MNHDGVIDESIAADETKVFEKCFQHIDEYATEGLRILLYGYKYISDEEYEAWNTAFQAASTSLVDRQDMIEEAAESLEQGFELAGASAIEDKLQAGVPETIDKLRRANIKVWMLTGDKRETAINIARSASLAKSFSQVYILDVAAVSLQEMMGTIFMDIERGLVSHSVLVIDGYTLSIVEEDDVLSSMFFELAVLIDSVICCRASPNQKATLVKGIRDTDPSCVTLAIGDGANDIAMIQASHVGIGISGREGLQAARVADYSIAQFRFLQRLLLVHGHWL
jgi:phospholipid-translocating ATPase